MRFGKFVEILGLNDVAAATIGGILIVHFHGMKIMIRVLSSPSIVWRHQKWHLRQKNWRRHGSKKATHTDIDSFLRHATATNLAPASTHYVGTLYEYTVLRALREFNISLHRTGGTDDKGVDLRGRWLLPQHTNYLDGIPVAIQCKAEKGPIGPKYLRELEGATMADQEGTIVLLAALSRFTEGARRVVMGSNRAMGVVLVRGYDDGGQVSQFMWNNAAGLLLGNELGVKTVFDSTAAENSETLGSRVLLSWNRSIIPTRKTIPGAP